MIVVFPAPVLHLRAQDVLVFDGALQALVSSMAEEMYSANGVGLAAPQVGRSERIVIVDPSAGDAANEMTVLINPKIVWASSDMNVDEEGCLSIPGALLNVVRPIACTVEYVDLKGNALTVTWAGKRARILQHEVDHLDGVLMVDRVGSLARKAALRSQKHVNG